MTEDNKANMGQLMAVVGTALMLARGSELHTRYRVGIFVDRLWPSIPRGQYALYTDKDSGKPVGFCNWSWISQDVLAEYRESSRPVLPADWDSGDVLFFQEMIAPFGHLNRITRDVRNCIVPHATVAYALRGLVRQDSKDKRQQRLMKFTGHGKTDGKPDSIRNIRTI